VSSLKVTEKVKFVYNDFLFGGVSWNKDGTKVVFVGEKPDISSYKPWFKDAAEDPKKEDDKKPEEHWQDEKFLYLENFGET